MKLIKNAKIVKGNDFEKVDILFDEAGIKEIAENIDAPDAEVVEAEGLVAMPGLIDVHVHLREPGNTHKETIKTGTKAAAAGGFTTLMAMPNVTPFPDDLETMAQYQKKIDEDALVNVIPLACITEQELGEKPVDMKAFVDAGYTAFSDDGVGVQKDHVMEKAMIMSAETGGIIVAHTEDMNYRGPGACMFEGEKSKELGLLGIPNECEWKQLERDLKLVEETNAHYHCCHMSAKKSVELLRQYKEKGLDVTGEVAAHHLILTDMDVEGPNWKMNPPLKSEEDRQAMIKGLLDGDVDMIANDHAPHGEDEKARGMVEGPFGIVALETSFPLLYTHLVKTGIATFEQLITWMSKAPAERFGFESKGQLAPGFDSDIVLVDIENKYTIDKNEFFSMGKNTPFHGWEVYGKVKATFVDGKLAYKEEK